MTKKAQSSDSAVSEEVDYMNVRRSAVTPTHHHAPTLHLVTMRLPRGNASPANASRQPPRARPRRQEAFAFAAGGMTTLLPSYSCGCPVPGGGAGA